MNENKSSGIFFTSLRSVLCVIMAGILAVSMIPITEQAYAANEEKADSVFLELGKIQRTDVTKTVVTLDANMGKGITIPFDVKDKYNNLGANEKRRYLVSEDAQGTQSQLSETSANRVGFMSDQIVAGNKLKLVTSTKDKNGNFVKRYEQQLNVRFVDTRKAEQKPSTATPTSAAAGMSKDGSSWSFTDGLQVELKNTGFKFLDGTSINLGGMALPLMHCVCPSCPQSPLPRGEGLKSAQRTLRQSPRTEGPGACCAIGGSLCGMRPLTSSGTGRGNHPDCGSCRPAGSGPARRRRRCPG